MSDEQTTYGYTPPVSMLLTLGMPKEYDVERWPDYITTYGFTSEHIPKLCRMVTDEALYESSIHDERPEIYSFIHALHVLGQLRDESALPFLIELAETDVENDYIWEILTHVIAMIGPVAIPLLKDALERQKNHIFTGLTITDCLEKMGLAHPKTKDECVTILTEQLERAEENDPGINASIIATLAIHFKAKEALPVIEKAFAGHYVDEMVMGDWDDVQVEMGLRALDPYKPRQLDPTIPEDLDILNRAIRATEREDANAKLKQKVKAKNKSKRKQVKKQKKQQRKRKK